MSRPTHDPFAPVTPYHAYHGDPEAAARADVEDIQSDMEPPEPVEEPTEDTPPTEPVPDPEPVEEPSAPKKTRVKRSPSRRRRKTTELDDALKALDEK